MDAKKYTIIVFMVSVATAITSLGIVLSMNYFGIKFNPSFTISEYVLIIIMNFGCISVYHNLRTIWSDAS